MANEEKAIIIPDTHHPIADYRKVAVLHKVIKQWKPDKVIILGDFDDMQAPSRFATGTPDEWKNRLSITTDTVTKKALQELRGLAKDAEFHYFEGNHEVRLEQYVAKKAPALDGLVTFPKIMDFANLGIQWHRYNSPPVKVFGNFYAHHGTKISATGAGKKELESYRVSGFSGHTHKLARYWDTTIGDGQLEWLECGHLVNVSKMDYTTVHNWQAGFGYAYKFGNKVFPFLAEFIGNTTYVDGVRFT